MGNMKNKAAQSLARLRHKKNPSSREHYKKMSELGRKGREEYWKKRREEKESIDSSSA